MSGVTKSNVLERGEPRCDMVGQRLPDPLYDTDQKISPGLVVRLRRYAEKGLEDAGFEISTWNCEVYTMDGNLPPSERYYCVEFVSPKGGMIGVQGIATNHGHPFLDHGICCDWGRS